MDRFKALETDILPVLCNKMNKIFQKQYDEFLKPYGLSKFHAFYLTYLAKFRDGLKMVDLNTLIGCDKANTSRAIADLIEKGIICKDNNIDKEKKYNVILTDKGLEIANALTNNSEQIINDMLGNLEQDEVGQLFYLIKKVLNGGEEDDTD